MKIADAAKVAKEKSVDIVSKLKSTGEQMLHEEKFFSQALEDPETVKAVLTEVIDGIDKGRILLKNEEDEMVLYPGNLLKMTIKGKRTSGKSKIKLYVSWSRTDEDRAHFDHIEQSRNIEKSGTEDSGTTDSE